MEEVWLPRQKRLEEHVTQRGPVEVQRRLRLYSRFLHYCNVKVGGAKLVLLSVDAMSKHPNAEKNAVS